MRLLYLTNIPTPYRIKRFNDLSAIMQQYKIELEVLFMAESEPNRNWVINYESIKFNYKIWSGIHPSFGQMYAHFNPSLLLRLLKKDYDYIVVGGISCPTLWMSKAFIPSRVKKIMSVETNLKGQTSKTGLKRLVKKYLLRGYDAYQVTGSPQREYIEYFSLSNNNIYIKLPNLIDHNLFRNLHLKKEERNYKLVIIPARIISYKIPSQFLDATRNLKNIRFIIVGTGAQEYVSYVKNRIIDENLPIEILDFVQQNDMVTLYNSADYFCLPTQEDPSPLSPIEAIACGLPLLISKLAGNVDDVLMEGLNGFSFDPYNSEEMASLFKKITLIEDMLYNKMSLQSCMRYNEVFDNEKCLLSYVQQILSL